MKIIKYILNEVSSFINLVSLNTSEADNQYMSEEILNEAIRLSKISLNDHFILKRPILLASTKYALAVNYYRKAIYFSNFNNEDINQSIFYAEQVKDFYTREENTFHWQQIQLILGRMYSAKGDGVRAEHFESAIGYLTNWLDSVSDINQQSEGYLALMYAYASRINGKKEENLKKVEKFCEKALNCYPNDLQWQNYVAQQKVIADMIQARSDFDHPTGNEGTVLSDSIKTITENQSWQDSNRFEPIQLFVMLNKFQSMLNKLLENIEEDISDFQLKHIQYIFNKGDLLGVIQEIVSIAPEKSSFVLTELDELILENMQFVRSLGKANEKNERAEGEMFLALLLIVKGSVCQEKEDIESSFETAESYFEKAWEYKTNFQKRPFIIFWQGKTFGTLLYFNRKKWIKSEKLYREALDALNINYKSSMGSPGKNIILSLLSAHDVPLSLNNTYALTKLGKKQEAVASLEKWRGRYLNEMLNRNNYMLGQIGEIDLKDYHQLWKEISKIELEMQDVDSVIYYELGLKLKEKRKDLDAVIARIRNYLPDFLLETEFSTIKNAAQDKEPLVYMLTTGMGCLILIVRSNGEIESLFFDEFTTAEALDLFEELQITISKVKSKQKEAFNNFAQILEKLGQYFIKDLINELDCKRTTSVCLIPCGILSQFPWHATPADDEKMLLDYFDVKYAPSSKFLFDAQQKLIVQESGKQENQLNKFVGVADPESDLKNAFTEVRSIVNKLNNNNNETILLSNNQATKKDLKNSMPSEILHFACHGNFDSQNPLESTLSLANNEKLILREVLEGDSLDFSQTRLAVLSACETALVDIHEKPEENVGLPLGFLSKGIPGVVGTLWSVNDTSSALLMTKFYEFWLAPEKDSKPKSPSKALMEAQRWFRKTIRDNPTKFVDRISDLEKTSSNRDAYSEAKRIDTYDNPYFWAGFVFIGE